MLSENEKNEIYKTIEYNLKHGNVKPLRETLYYCKITDIKNFLDLINTRYILKNKNLPIERFCLNWKNPDKDFLQDIYDRKDICCLFNSFNKTLNRSRLVPVELIDEFGKEEIAARFKTILKENNADKLELLLENLYNRDPRLLQQLVNLNIKIAEDQFYPAMQFCLFMGQSSAEIYEKSLECCEILKNYGANPEVKDYKQRSFENYRDIVSDRVGTIPGYLTMPPFPTWKDNIDDLSVNYPSKQPRHKPESGMGMKLEKKSKSPEVEV